MNWFHACDSPEDFLRLEVTGAVLPLGGEPTVNTTRTGLLQPADGLVPPPGGATGDKEVKAQ